MRTFTDTEGRDWDLAITVTAAKRIKARGGPNLLEIGETALYEQLADPFTLVETLWNLVEPQAERRGVGPEEFGESLAGDTLEAAADALLQAVVDFFPSRRRGILNRSLARLREVQDAMLTAAEKTLDDPHLTEQIERLTALATPGGPSTNWPAASASTPAR